MERPGRGLRERNREERYERIRSEALAAFIERGFDDVTVEEIADRAAVSPSTLFRYFPTKEDLVAAGDAARLDALRDAFADRPAFEPVLASLRAVLVGLAESYQEDGPDLLRRYKVIRATPSLTARILEQQSAREEALASAIADRLDDQPGAEIRARVLAATGMAIVRVVMRDWISQERAVDLPALVAEALDVLASELTPAEAH